MQDNNSTNRKKWIVTPEECLFSDISEIDTSRLHDALNCALVRAQSVLSLIQADGGDLAHGFTLSHETIMSALWSLYGDITQARIILDAELRK